MRYTIRVIDFSAKIGGTVKLDFESHLDVLGTKSLKRLFDFAGKHLPELINSHPTGRAMKAEKAEIAFARDRGELSINLDEAGQNLYIVIEKWKPEPPPKAKSKPKGRRG